MRPYRPAALAALICAAVALTGCDPAPSAAPIGGAPAATAATPDRAVADAVASTLAAGTARVTADLDSFAGPVAASGPVRFTPFAADLSVTVRDRDAAIRTVDGRSWLRSGDAWQPVAPGLVPVGALPGAVRAAAALRDVTVTGPDTVDGVPATRYLGSVDLDAAAVADPAAAGPLRELAGLVSTRPGVEVWVGSDGRVARLRLTPAGPAAAGGPVTLRLADPGVPVEITAPPT